VISASVKNWRLLLAATLTFALAAGCGARKPAPSSSQAQNTSSDQGAGNQLAPPEAKIHVSYSHPDDYLQSMTVTKYEGAQLLRGGSGDQNSGETVRFEGGIVVWQFAIEKPLLSSVPVIGGNQKRYAPSEIKYGALPDHFLESVPDNGPPETLEGEHYYVFQVARASGSTSYEAVKVNDDGSLEAYAAEPRAGDSYELCCGVAADFTMTPPVGPPSGAPPLSP
jgi:hypothetical protein